MRRTTIKIQSVSDIITNSSTEVFIIETDKSPEEVLKEILSWNIPIVDFESQNEDEDRCGGWGSDITIKNNKKVISSTVVSDFMSPYDYLEDNQMGITIDRLRRATAHKIIETYNVIDQW